MKEKKIYVWQYGQKGEGLYKIEVEHKDGRSLNRIQNILESEGWKLSGTTSSKNSKGFLMTQSFDDGFQGLEGWAKKFPEPVIYLNSSDKEIQLNFKKGRGRPKKDKK